MAGASFTWNFDQLERRFGVAVRHFGKLNELTAAIGGNPGVEHQGAL